MPLSISTELQEHLDQEVTTLARILKVTRKDGTELFFTDSDTPLVFEGDTYRADVSFTSSAILATSEATNAQTVTVEAIMDDLGFKEADIRRRLYDAADVVISILNYEDPSMGAMIKFSGIMGEIKITDKNRMIFEVRARGSVNGGDLAQERYSATCRASLGDARCGIDIEALKVAITVDAVSGQVVSASELTQADNHWQLGYVRFATGANAGATFPIASSNLATNSITLTGLPASAVVAGDTAFVYPGCDRTLRTCVDRFSNPNNFRGEPYVPSLTTVTVEEVVTTQVGLPSSAP
jgi:uncharacterized phage protein (TIGR02218 family)